MQEVQQRLVSKMRDIRQRAISEAVCHEQVSVLRNAEPNRATSLKSPKARASNTGVHPSAYREALKKCASELEMHVGAKGLEGIIHKALLAQLADPTKRKEVRLSSVGGQLARSEGDGRVDIVCAEHGIELKAVRLPRHKMSTFYSLYDLGQLASDYWRLRGATGLRSGELVVLLYGPLVADLPNEAAVYREFHNRMYVDFATSRQFGELSPAWLAEETDQMQLLRKRQTDAIRQIGFHKPCGAPQYKTVREGNFALVSIDVK